MISQKELTIYELLEELKNLKKEYYKLATILAKRIEPLKGLSYGDVNSTIKGRGGVKDTMTNNLAKAEEYQTKLDAIKDSIESYQAELIQKLNNVYCKKRSKEKVIFLRNEMHASWNDIAFVLGLSERQCMRLYGRRKKI